jgi:hypothetical protein
MTEHENERYQALLEKAEEEGDTNQRVWWLELIKVAALPLVTLILGFTFNKSLNDRQARETAALSTRQAQESNMRLYTEMMGRREQADSELRKDMFRSILDTFMSKDPQLNVSERLRQDVLNLELMAYNFHESLDIGPLFKDVRSRIPYETQGPYAVLRGRLEKVAQEVIERQLTVLADTGMVERGDASPDKIDSLQAYMYFGSHTVPDPDVKPGEGIPRLCLSLESTDEERHWRQFKLELIKQDPLTREVQVRLYVSEVLSEENCRNTKLDLEGAREIDTNFWLGLFDFPMIDNTRLSHGERCSVSLSALNRNVIQLALAYFPGSRASLKDKPYYDELMHDLVRIHGVADAKRPLTSRR